MADWSTRPQRREKRRDRRNFFPRGRRRRRTRRGLWGPADTIYRIAHPSTPRSARLASDADGRPATVKYQVSRFKATGRLLGGFFFPSSEGVGTKRVPARSATESGASPYFDGNCSAVAAGGPRRGHRNRPPKRPAADRRLPLSSGPARAVGQTRPTRAVRVTQQAPTACIRLDGRMEKSPSWPEPATEGRATAACLAGGADCNEGMRCARPNSQARGLAPTACSQVGTGRSEPARKIRARVQLRASGGVWTDLTASKADRGTKPRRCARGAARTIGEMTKRAAGRRGKRLRLLR